MSLEEIDEEGCIICLQQESKKSHESSTLDPSSTHLDLASGTSKVRRSRKVTYFIYSHGGTIAKQYLYTNLTEYDGSIIDGNKQKFWGKQ